MARSVQLDLRQLTFVETNLQCCDLDLSSESCTFPIFISDHRIFRKWATQL